MMQIYWELKTLSSDKHYLPVGLEDHVLLKARGGQGAVYRAAQRQAVNGEIQILPQVIPLHYATLDA